MASDLKKPAVLFLHIPKAAGTTVYSILSENYPPESIFTMVTREETEHWHRLPPQEKVRFDLVRGHFQFGLHESLPRPAVYFTMLRKPVERVISNYYYVRSSPWHPLHKEVVNQKLSLREYLEVNVAVDNGQTRQLCGYSSTVPAGQCNREMLEAAKRNLNSCAVVGLTERFDETMLLLQRTFGWKTPCYRKENVTATRPPQAEIAPEDFEAIEQKNRLDAELYESACSLFEKALARQSADFKTAVSEFRKSNAERNADAGRKRQSSGRWAGWVKRFVR